MKTDRFFWLAALLPALIFLLPGCSKKETVQPPTGAPVILKDVVYGKNINWQGENQSLAMDIYFPSNMEAGKKYPLAVFAHGGGFVTGDKANSAVKCSILTDSGFIAVSINYRYGWDNGGGTCVGDTTSLGLAAYRAMQDENAALRFLVANADQYAIDTNWIFIGGASAGATMALTSTYITDANAKQTFPESVEALGGLQNATNNLTNTYTIKGIFSIAGGLEDSTLITQANAVPTIFFQGDADEVIPVDYGTYMMCSNFPKLVGSLCIYRQLGKYNKPAIAHILHGAGHGNNGDSGFDNPFMMSNTACFFKRLMEKQVISSSICPDFTNSCQ